MTRGGAALVAICLIAGPAAAAPPTSPITDSNYSIELYDGVAYGNAAVVGMGGATVALGTGTAGTLFNPSAPAVRMTTDIDHWSWDYHLDAIAGSSTDYDNNGIAGSYAKNAVGTLGLGGRYGDWGAAFTATWQNRPIITPDASEPNLEATTYRFQLAVARWIRRIDTSIGVSLRAGQFTLDDNCDEDTGTCTTRLFQVSGAGLELGGTWVPREQSFRAGAALSGPIHGADVKGCDPNDCQGWILPESIVSATRISIGGAYRFAGTAWNRLVSGYFRDEKSITVATDVVITAPVANGFGLEAFGDHELQRSGRDTSISVRGGAEYEWLPGRLRVRGGSYWEPGRFVAVSGRLHVTLGVEVRVFQFHLWGKPRRGRISVTADAAERYANGGVSIGFWH